MTVLTCPEAIKLITLEAFNKTIDDAAKNGLKLTTESIINEVTSNKDGAIAKRFLTYIELGHDAFKMVGG